MFKILKEIFKTEFKKTDFKMNYRKYAYHVLAENLLKFTIAETRWKN